MLRIIATLMILASAAAAQQSSQQTAPRAQPETLPKGATANADGTWSWTDGQGQHWIYRQTDFGFARAAAPAAHAVIPAGVPADAVPAKDGSYIWTDKAGKKWTYRMSMFGLSKTPYVDPETVKTPPPGDGVKVTEKGDTVRFERASPFGPQVWEKKKTDLTPDEKKIYDAQKAKD